MFRLFAVNRFVGSLLLAVVAIAHASTRPHYGGTLRVEVQTDPWQGPDSIGRSLVFDSLTRVGASGETEPALATRWSSQNGNHRWQFWFRQGVHFNDGTLLTPDLVLQSLNRSCTQCPWTTVRALNDSLVFTTSSPNPVLPAELSRSLYAIAKTDASGIASGTGAFRFVSYQNYVLSLAAVDDAWQGRPFVDAVQISGRRFLRIQWLDLLSGQADIVDVPPENLRQAQQEHLNVVQSPACDLLVLSLSHVGMLADDSQREAISSAVDRAAIYNVIFQKQGEVTASLLPNTFTGYSFLFPVERDLGRAQTSKIAGSRTPLTLSVDDGSAAVRLAADRLALNLQEAGFHIQVTNRLANTDSSGTPDLVLRKIHRESGENQAALQQMLESFGQQLSDESSDPAALYRQESTFLQTHFAVPLLLLPRAYAVGPRVHGIRLSSGGLPLIADVSLEDTK